MWCVNTLPGIEPVMPLYMYSLTWPDRRHVRAIYCMKSATGSEEKVSIAAKSIENDIYV